MLGLTTRSKLVAAEAQVAYKDILLEQSQDRQKRLTDRLEHVAKQLAALTERAIRAEADLHSTQLMLGSANGRLGVAEAEIRRLNKERESFVTDMQKVVMGLVRPTGLAVEEVRPLPEELEDEEWEKAHRGTQDALSERFSDVMPGHELNALAGALQSMGAPASTIELFEN